MSPGNKNDSVKKRNIGNRLSTVFRTFFGCVSKRNSHVERIDKEYVSVSCQCQEEKELELSCDHEEEQILVESKAKLDITLYKENEIAPLTEEFRSSLNKLDSLINTLHDIHDVYKNNTSLKYLNEQIQELIYPGEENIGNGEIEEEYLKFNINFDENTFIQCHTNRGKHSLKIVHSSGQQNFNPLIPHRCESEFLLIQKNQIDTTNNRLFNNRKSRSETCHEKFNQLQRSNHTLSSHFGCRIFNLATFKSTLTNHMRNIREDVKTLRHILYSFEYTIQKGDMAILPFNFGEIRKWFMGGNNKIQYGIHEDQYIIRKQEHRFIEAQIRASNFCKFYTLSKKLKENGKVKKRKKKKK